MNRPLTALLLLALAACSGTKGGSASPDAAATDLAAAGETAPDAGTGADGADDDYEAEPPNPSLDPWCVPWVEMACKRALACKCPLAKDKPLTPQNCPARMREVCEDDMFKIGQMMEAGLVLIRAEEVAACLAALEAAVPGCLLPGRKALGLVSCIEVFAQALNKKGECWAANAPCPNGMGCVEHACTGVRQADGAACQADGECKSLDCDVLETHTCQPLPALGADCEDHYECPWGVAACIEGKCKKPPQLGESCLEEIGCDLMLVCSGGKCVAPAAACTVGDECATGATCLPTSPPSCQPMLCEELAGLDE